MSNEHPMDRAIRLVQNNDQKIAEARQRNYAKTEQQVQPNLSSEAITANIYQVADQWRVSHDLPTMAEEAAQREAQRNAYAQDSARRNAATMAAVKGNVTEGTGTSLSILFYSAFVLRPVLFFIITLTNLCPFLPLYLISPLLPHGLSILSLPL